MTKVSIQSQIAAVEAAADGKTSTLRGNARELLIDQLRAAAQTLRFIRRHEAEIRAIAEKNGGAK
jgi:hypothetical protein